MSLGEDWQIKYVIYNIWHHMRTIEQRKLHPSQIVQEFIDWVPPEIGNKENWTNQTFKQALQKEVVRMKKSPNFLQSYGYISTLMANNLRWKDKEGISEEQEIACYMKMFGRPRFKDKWEREREKKGV